MAHTPMAMEAAPARIQAWRASAVRAAATRSMVGNSDSAASRPMLVASQPMEPS